MTFGYTCIKINRKSKQKLVLFTGRFWFDVNNMFYKQQVLTANLNERKSLICNVQSIFLKGSSRVKKSTCLQVKKNVF